MQELGPAARELQHLIQKDSLRRSQGVDKFRLSKLIKDLDSGIRRFRLKIIPGSLTVLLLSLPSLLLVVS